MSAYLITREGQELGFYTTSQIEKGLETGFFRVSDLAWCETEGWKGVTEIVVPIKAPAPVLAQATVPAPAQAPALGPSPAIAPDEPPELKPVSPNPIAVNMAHARAAASAMVTPAVMSQLSRTWPWLRFISSVMAIGCVLMILAGLFLAANGEDTWTALRAQHLSQDTRLQILAAVGTLLTFLILYPALKLSNYAAHIARLAETQSPTDLAAALAEQRRVWRFCGILTLLYLSGALLLGFTIFFATRTR